jgi:hypothetical protein
MRIWWLRVRHCGGEDARDARGFIEDEVIQYVVRPQSFKYSALFGGLLSEFKIIHRKWKREKNLYIPRCRLS